MTLEILIDDQLGFRKHGFFTRRGGASSGIFNGLNCAISSSDQTAAVMHNRARVAEAMGVAAQNLITARQVHSDTVVEVDVCDVGSTFEADGLVTCDPAIAIAVLTADCQPVLFADPKAEVIGAVHAGWKGAKSGILENAVAKMEELGARRERIVAVVGPTISQEAYEVGPEFHDAFKADDPESTQFFRAGQGDRMQFDLPGYSIKQLRLLGVGSATWMGDCTYSDPDRFFSYRRSVHEKQADYGRLISTIRL